MSAVAAARVGNGLVGRGAVGSGAVGRGAVGRGAVGSGAVGRGAVGSGAVGSGAVGRGAVGSGAVGRGAVGSGVVGIGKVAIGTSAGAICCEVTAPARNAQLARTTVMMAAPITEATTVGRSSRVLESAVRPCLGGGLKAQFKSMALPLR